MIDAEKTIFIALPTYNGDLAGHLAVSLMTTQIPLRFIPRSRASSFLSHAFNQFWCEALNCGADYFLMVHADIVPVSENWITLLLREMEDRHADAIGVVSPIKDNLGRISTGIGTRRNRDWQALMLAASALLPETFSASDVAALLGRDPADAQLLLNTGLLLVDLKTKRKAVEQLYFQMQSNIERDGAGQFIPWAQGEDWLWSIDAQELGLSLLATRKIHLVHRGWMEFHNSPLPLTIDTPPPLQSYPART